MKIKLVSNHKPNYAATIEHTKLLQLNELGRNQMPNIKFTPRTSRTVDSA